MKLRLVYERVKQYDRFGIKRLWVRITKKPPVLYDLIRFYNDIIDPVDFKKSDPDITGEMHSRLIKIFIAHFDELDNLVAKHPLFVGSTGLKQDIYDFILLERIGKFPGPDILLRLDNNDLFSVYAILIRDNISIPADSVFFNIPKESTAPLKSLCQDLSRNGRLNQVSYDTIMSSLRFDQNCANHLRKLRPEFWDRVMQHSDPTTLLRAICFLNDKLFTDVNCEHLLSYCDPERLAAVLLIGNNDKTSQYIFDAVMDHSNPKGFANAISDIQRSNNNYAPLYERELINSPCPEDLAQTLKQPEFSTQEESFKQSILKSSRPLSLLSAAEYLRQAGLKDLLPKLLESQADPLALASAIIKLKWMHKLEGHLEKLVKEEADPLAYTRRLRTEMEAEKMNPSAKVLVEKNVFEVATTPAEAKSEPPVAARPPV